MKRMFLEEDTKEKLDYYIPCNNPSAKHPDLF